MYGKRSSHGSRSSRSSTSDERYQYRASRSQAHRVPASNEEPYSAQTPRSYLPTTYQAQSLSGYPDDGSQGNSWSPYGQAYPTPSLFTSGSSELSDELYGPPRLEIDTGYSLGSSTQHRSSLTSSANSVSPGTNLVNSFYQIYSPRPQDQYGDANFFQSNESQQNQLDYSFSDIWEADGADISQARYDPNLLVSPRAYEGSEFSNTGPSPQETTAAPDSSSSARTRATHACPFPDCDRHERPFTRFADQQRHIAHVHYPEQQPRHDCIWPGCKRQGNKGFARRDHMLEHVRHHHHIELPRRTPGRSGSG